MSQAALSLKNLPESKWTVLTGSMKGKVRLLSLPVFVIGRSPDCEFIIVNDPKCSRLHAKVIYGIGGYEVHGMSEKNAVFVNEREVQRSPLKDGDIVRIGDTEIQFNIVIAAPLQIVPQHPIAPNGSQALGDAAVKWQQGGVVGTLRKRGKATRIDAPHPKRFIIYGVIGLILFWLLSPSTKKKAEVSIRDEQQIEADIESANRLRDAAEMQQMARVDRSVSARQAQENYVRGFRDYQKSQFERAMISFNACLALNPEHALCNRYAKLSQRKFNEVVQFEMVLGRKYRDQNQFKFCRASFRNVMVMVKDASSPIFREAKANYDACTRLVEGRY